MRGGPKLEPKVKALPTLWGKTPSERFREFCVRFLRHQQGPLAGKPVILADWQMAIVSQLLDTVNDKGLRKYREAFITLARRNGKTVLCACLALFELYYGEEGGEIIGAAGDRAQAMLAYTTARKMVEACPELAQVTQIYIRQLVVPCRMNSTYRVVSSDAPRQHGINVSFALIDELHAHKNRQLYDALRTGTGSRAQPIIMVVSTATDDPHSVMAEMYRYACQVRDGVIADETFLPVIHSAPLEADPFNEATWALANPALGTFRDLDEFRIYARQAKEIPGRMASFRALYLNQMFSGADKRWLALDQWDACQVDTQEDWTGQRVFVGLDLSATTDLTAMVLLKPDGEGGYDVRAEYWAPEDTIKLRTARDHVPYQVWHEMGRLRVTPGNSVDYSFVEARLREVCAEMDVAEIAFDPWNARGMTSKLLGEGFPIVEVQQSYLNLTDAAKTLERMILSRALRHDGHPILRWNVSNTVANLDAQGNIMPSKKRSYERIDGVSALVTALARALVDTGASVYESRGLLTV